jgi:hypothetical protein
VPATIAFSFVVLLALGFRDPLLICRATPMTSPMLFNKIGELRISIAKGRDVIVSQVGRRLF